jgi:hypothetical protein
MSEPFTAQSFQVPASADQVRQRATILGVVGLVAMLVGAFTNIEQFFRSYLVAFVFWTSVPLGCLGLLMVQHLSGGAWGLVIRRILEAAARTLPVMAVLFLPLIAGLGHVYEWAHPEVVAADPILLGKEPFLNAPFWIVRSLIYFAIWSTMALLLTKWSADQDAGRPGAPLDHRFARLSGPGLVVYGLTMSLASIDWLMSVDPHWFSTIYGFIMIGGAGLAALAFVILTIFTLMREAPMAGVMQEKHLHDLGKLTFAFVMLYAYFSFSQFLIIWSANLPEEIPFYIRRYQGSWQILFLTLVAGHFVLPFAILLSANIKRNLRRLSLVATLLFVMRILDVLFQVAPYYHDRLTIHWIDVAAIVGLGGVWIAVFLFFLKGRPLLPVNDPYLREALADHGAH